MTSPQVCTWFQPAKTVSTARRLVRNPQRHRFALPFSPGILALPFSPGIHAFGNSWSVDQWSFVDDLNCRQRQWLYPWHLAISWSVDDLLVISIVGNPQRHCSKAVHCLALPFSPGMRGWWWTLTYTYAYIQNIHVHVEYIHVHIEYMYIYVCIRVQCPWNCSISR